MPAFPTWLANGAVAADVGAITPGLPAGIQEYDVMFLFVETDDQAVATPSGGWASMFSGAQGGATRLQIFWKRVGAAAETAPLIADAGDHQIGIISAFRGCATTGNPWDVLGASANGVSNTATASTITTTVANTLVVYAFSTSGLNNMGTVTNANLANITERVDTQTSAGNDGTLAMGHGEKATAGSVGATSQVIGGAANPGWATVQFALRNADEIVVVPPISATIVTSPTVQNENIYVPFIDSTTVVYSLKVGTHIRLTQMPTEVVLEPEPDMRLTQMPVEVVRRQSNEIISVVWWD